MKRYLLIGLFAAAAFLPAAAQSVSEVSHLEDSLKAWRHYIHRNPELSYKEYATSRYVADRLRSFGGIEVSHPTETSVLGILRGGKPGPVVAFRADMDALPVQEQTDFPFSSRIPGVSHACGHDMHTAMLLGTARVLASRRDELPGTVYFIFQHAEEMAPGGAKEIIATGVLDSVEAFFGAHVMANYPVGSIGILPAGAASTAADGFLLTIIGKGTHGSMPQSGIDPIVTGSEIVMLLQTIVSRNAAPGEMAVVSVGKFQSGDAPNVIPDKAELAATIRTVTDATRKLVEQRVRTIVDAVCTANGAKYDLNYVLSYPAVQNSPSCVRWSGRPRHVPSAPTRCSMPRVLPPARTFPITVRLHPHSSSSSARATARSTTIPAFMPMTAHLRTGSGPRWRFSGIICTRRETNKVVLNPAAACFGAVAIRRHAGPSRKLAKAARNFRVRSFSGRRPRVWLSFCR